MPKLFTKYSVRRLGASELIPRDEDIEAMVHLHKSAFPGFFLTLLGPRFLRLMYSSFVSTENGVCIVAENGQGLLGFAVGTSEPKVFFKTLLLKHGLSFALAATSGLVRNPVFVARKCLGAILYRGEEPKGMTQAGLLSSLAVSPNALGKGIGRELVDTFCDELRRRGVAAVYLTTDASDNDPVNRFYERCKFRLVDTFERPGKRRMNRWARKLECPDLHLRKNRLRDSYVESPTL